MIELRWRSASVDEPGSVKNQIGYQVLQYRTIIGDSDYACLPIVCDPMHWEWSKWIDVPEDEIS